MGCFDHTPYSFPGALHTHHVSGYQILEDNTEGVIWQIENIDLRNLFSTLAIFVLVQMLVMLFGGFAGVIEFDRQVCHLVKNSLDSLVRLGRSCFTLL